MSDQECQDSSTQLVVPQMRSKADQEKLYVFYTAAYAQRKDLQQDNQHQSSQSESEEQNSKEQQPCAESETELLRKYSLKKIKRVKLESGEESQQQKPASCATKKKRQRKSADKNMCSIEIAVVYKKPVESLGVRRIQFKSSSQPLGRSEREDFERDYRKLLVFGEDFDLDLYEKCGGFLNSKFWQLNITHLTREEIHQDALGEIVSRIANRIKDKMRLA